MTRIDPSAADAFRITAGATHAGQRLDRFLADAIGTLSRSRVKALIESGQARQGDATLRVPAEPVRAGTAYTLHLPPPTPATPQPQAIALTILYEDSDLIVLDKPAGLVVHPAPGNLDGTLVNALLAHCGPGFTGIGAERRPGIVHRLDKDTSGVMVVAKTQAASDGLTAAFAARDLDRAYLALCWGVPSPLAGEIEGAIGRDPRERKRMAVVTRGGKPALTRYRHRAHASNPRSSRRPGSSDRRRPALPAPHSGRRPVSANAASPDPAGFPPPGAARRKARLRPPGHRPVPGVRNPAAGGLPGVAGGAGLRSACTAALSYRDLTKG